jgi:hypothetical protein
MDALTDDNKERDQFFSSFSFMANFKILGK